MGSISNPATKNDSEEPFAEEASSSSLEMRTCPPQNLAAWLLKHRFGGNEMDLTNFLLEAVSSLPNAQAISDQLVEEQGESIDLGRELLTSASQELSLIVPRVKAKATWYSEGIRFEDKKQESFILPKSSVERMIVFPKPEDCQPKKKPSVDMILLALKDSATVSYKNKSVKQLCLQLPTSLPQWHATDDEEDDDDDWTNLDHSDQWTRVFCASLGLDIPGTARVINPCTPENSSGTFWRYQFESHQEESTSTTTGGMPFVKCYHGVNDGVLYPMQEGLLFFKPPLFLHRSSLHSIACGRGGGADTSRYVDLTIVDGHETTLEFTNIHRSELAVMREYIHKVLIPAMKKDLKGGDAEADGSPNDEVEGVASEAASVEEEIESSSRPKKRKASLEARSVAKRMQLESDEDEEADDDYSGRGDDESEQEDEDEVSTTEEDNDAETESETE